VPAPPVLTGDYKPVVCTCLIRKLRWDWCEHRTARSGQEAFELLQVEGGVLTQGLP
jgi:hypothetical protein